MDRDREETVETTLDTPGAREEDDTEESAREAAEALAVDEVEAALAAGGGTAAQALTPVTPKRTAKEKDGEKRVALRIRQILAAEREAVDGFERKRKRAEAKGRREVGIKQLARKSAGAGPVTQVEKVQIYDACYREVPWTELMYDRSCEIKDGADAEKIARKELGVEDPKKKRKEWDVIRRSTPLRGISTPASPGASGNGSASSTPSNPGGGTGSDEYKQQP